MDRFGLLSRIRMLRTLWTVVVLFVATPLFAIPAILISLLRPRSNVCMIAARGWSRVMLQASGAQVHYSGLAPDRWPEPCVFVSNHQSNVDIWALLAVTPPSTRFVAKQVLFRVPLMGWAMSATGFIPIDRTNRASAIRSLDRAADRVRNGRSILLFAEGTRSISGELQPFKKGPFHLALRAGAPVVPLAIAGSWEVMQPRGLRVRPGRVEVRALPPIDPLPYRPDDHDGLRASAHAAIEAALRELQPARGAVGAGRAR